MNIVASHICQNRAEPFDSLRSLRPGCGAPRGLRLLFEKDGLGGFGVFGVAEVVQADADEAEALRGGEADAFAQGERDAGELVAGGDGLGRRKRAGEDFELRRLELKDDGARDTGFFAGGSPDLFGEAANGVGSFFEGNVALEGVFGGDGFGGAVGDDGVFVDAVRQLTQPLAVTAKVFFHCY